MVGVSFVLWQCPVAIYGEAKGKLYRFITHKWGRLYLSLGLITGVKLLVVERRNGKRERKTFIT